MNPVPEKASWYVKHPDGYVPSESFETKAEADRAADKMGGTAFQDLVIYDVNVSDGQLLQFDFTTYDPTNGKPSNQDIEWGLPEVLAAYKNAIILKAGFSLSDNPCIGLLDVTWRRHPKRAIIVAPHTNFRPGFRFAVSDREAP